MATFKPYANFDKHMNARRGGAGVGDHLRRKAQEVERISKVLVGVDTGTLRKNIRAGHPQRHAFGLIVDVTANTPYAYHHHQGSGPHTITPSSGKALSFGNGIVVSKVNHPGTSANKYLSRALRIAMSNEPTSGLP